MPRSAELERQCALTREVRPAAELIRFVVGPDGRIWPDVDERAEGRGVWITADQDSVGEAVRRKSFAKSLKAPVEAPDDLADLTRQHLEQRMLGALGMARKAGQLVNGATRVRDAIQKGEVIALISATDAAEDGVRKLVALLRGLQNGDPVPHLQIVGSDRLGLALGLDNVIHAALTNGAAARSALARAVRLARFITPKNSV